MIGNLSQVVRDNVADDEVHLIPVIEKELIHYDVLAALEKLGLLERLVFHGGTCLRLCYGAQRRSEDLDFAYNGPLDELDLNGLGDLVSETLGRKFGLTATVRPPRKTVEFATAKMQRWWMVVDTAPERPDLPSQKLKIELISVETFTSEVRRVTRNYDYLAPSAGNTLAVCESMGEILADKMVSFVNTPTTYVRSRDVWDMMYLLSRPECDVQSAFALVPKKRQIYGCRLSDGEFASAGEERVRNVAGSPDFSAEMRRFMPPRAYEELFGSSLKQRFAIEEACSLYQKLGRSFVPNRGIPVGENRVARDY